jgi:hypothetical protein
LPFAQIQTLSRLNDLDPMLGYRRDNLDPLELTHTHRDETTLIHDQPLDDALCQRAPGGRNRTFLISQKRPNGILPLIEPCPSPPGRGAWFLLHSFAFPDAAVVLLSFHHSNGRRFSLTRFPTLQAGLDDQSHGNSDRLATSPA